MILLRCALVCLMLGLLAGCNGSGNVVVTGEVRHDGTVYQPEPGEQVMVTFGEEKQGQVSGNVFPTRLSPEGTFEMSGPDNLGIPPGTYRVSITCMPEVMTPGTAPPPVKFPEVVDIRKSPLLVEVNSSQRTAILEIP